VKKSIDISEIYAIINVIQNVKAQKRAERKETMFEKITPEEAGVSSAHVAEFISALNRRSMPMHSVLMMKGDKLFAEYYWAPFNKDTIHRMYSQTKSYTSVAIGLLAEEGKIDLDRPMSEYFPDRIDKELPEFLRLQTVREMLTMTTVGEAANWFAHTEEPDRTHMYFTLNRKNGRSAGTIWEYDSAGSQVLSTLVEKMSGMSTFEYLNEKIFRHLGTFRTATMLKTRNGDSWGDSALVCTPRDMMSFARFVMNYGTWNGKRLMNEEYLRAATARQVDNSENLELVFRHGYGYQIWQVEEGFAFVGMGAQFTICLPERDMIFVCTADTQGLVNANDFIVGRFYDTIVRNMSKEPLPECESATRVLKNATSDLRLYSVKGAEDSPMRKQLDGAVYECDVPNPMGWKTFSLSFSEDGKTGTLTYVNAQGEKKLPFGINHNVFGKFPQLGYSNDFGGLRTTDGFMYDDAVSAAWVQDNKLLINVQIIDRYFGNGRWTVAFKDNYATVRMFKTAEDFLNEYNGVLTAKRK